MRAFHPVVTLILFVGVHASSLTVPIEATSNDSPYGNTSPKGVNEPPISAQKISLNLRSTALKILPEGFLTSEHLTDLTLDHNQIETISSWAFRDLPKLAYLSLTSNNIQHLDLAAFDNLKNLDTLRLDGNCRVVVEEATIPPTNYENSQGMVEDDDDSFKHRQSRGLFDWFAPVVHNGNMAEDDDDSLEDADSGGSIDWFSQVNNSRLIHQPSIRTKVSENRCIFHFSEHLPKLTHLYLQNNNLKSLVFPDGELTSLTHLYLSENPLTMSNGTDIRLGNFAPFLRHLRLDECGLRELDVSSLKHATEIHLENNEFQSICNRYCDDSSLRLEGSVDLEILWLNSNKISEIEVYSFNHTVNLTIIDLSNNKLSNIRQGTFDKLQRLVSLNLSGNKLTKITGNFFKGLKSMRTLDLGFNLIQHLDVDSFEPLVSLENLSLNQNQITNVEPGTLSSLIHLKKLYLGANQLQAIPEGCVPFSGSLSDLDLSYNQFYDADQIVLGNSSGIVELNLSGNSLNAIATRWFATLPINSTVHFRKRPGNGGRFWTVNNFYRDLDYTK